MIEHFGKIEVGTRATMTTINMEDSDGRVGLWRDNEVFGYIHAALIISDLLLKSDVFIWLFKLHV